jgi:hypothetical protein
VLPAGHAGIASIRFYVPTCVGYCPLSVSWNPALVIFYLTDHTRPVASVWSDGGRLHVEYEGADAW